MDAILPEIEMASIETDEPFWDAIEKTNRDLEESGFYLTHLFLDSQIILRPDWLEFIVPVPLAGLRFLQLERPATEDLVLTKMMRVDPQDRSDIEFLLGQISIDSRQLESLLRSAKIPDIPEIREAYEENAIWLRNLV